MPAPSSFDPLRTVLDTFVRRNAAEIEKLGIEVASDVLAPRALQIGRNRKQGQAVELIPECFATTGASFASVASRRSLDPWMSFLRRYPRQPHWPNDW